MRMISKFVIVLFIVLSVVTVSGTNPVLAEDSSDDSLKWRGGPHIGFSYYTGILGVELQKGNWGFTLGIPAAIGVRYYFDEQGYRWFIGAHALYYSFDDADETKDGILYDELSSTNAGFGAGYKWRIKNHWDITLSLSIIWNREELKNDYISRTDDYILAMPGITFGYTF